ncbi:MAG: T9SS type A sorting domain-containing protein [Bacteroidales bacterium]|nr:T9SS type A sorting domain-containing protein [Bacteroidales bacterium]
MRNVYFKANLNSFFPFVSILLILCILPLSAIKAQNYAIDFGKKATGVQVTDDNMQGLKAGFSFAGVTTFTVESPNGQFNELGIPNAYWTGKIGQPKLPASKQLIEIPFGATVTAKVLNSTVTEYKLSDYGISNRIMPVQPSLRKDQNADEVEFVFDEKIYSQDEFITHETVSVDILGVMRSYRMARLTVNPVSYNPVKGIIRVMNDIEIELTFNQGDEQLTKYVKASTVSPYFDVIHKSLMNTLDHDYPAHPDLTTYPIKYLIVSDRMFETDLIPFIEWKTKKGFEVIVAYTDVIGSTYTAIQSYVHEQYNNGTPEDPAPSFVLFVGDTPQIPATVGNSSGKMTDLYYGSVDGDYFPEMYYGRFSARTSAQLTPQIEKTLYYERYEFTDPTYLDNTTLIAGADGTWNWNVGQPTVNYGTQNYFNAEHGFADVYSYLTSPYTGCYGPDKIAVSFINYTAHCSETSWGDPGLSQSQVNAFENDGKYPLAVGNCCLAADFGYTECMGETWARGQNKGSVVYIGSSPSSYWFEDFYWAVGAYPIQGDNDGYTPTYDETTWGAYDGPFMSDYVSAGGMVSIGNLSVTEVDIQGWPQHSSPLYYWQAYNVLGDPSVVTYMTQGNTNSVTHLPIMPIGLTTYDVTAEPGSYVAISKDGILHGTALVGETGLVTVPIDPVLSSGLVDIVVTKPQFIPYMVQVTAAALDGPYVVMDSYVIQDVSGNANGQADYSETFGTDVTLKNVGSDPSASVTATITGTDDFATLTSPASVNFGIIANGATATVANAYTFEIDDFVPSGHNAIFVVESTDGSEIWTSNLIITLNAPILEISEEVVVNDLADGNGDGILDPGETADLMITVSNTGTSDAANLVLTTISEDNLLVINTDQVALTDLATGQTGSIAVGVTASSDAPVGTPVNLSLELSADPDGVYSASQNAMVVIGLTPEILMQNGTINTCIANFFDTGGEAGEYTDNQNYTLTLMPATEGAMLNVEFISFATESGYDYLYIYDGSTTDAPEVLGSPFDGTNSPGIIQSTNESGALTFRFTSDGSYIAAGWFAEVSCYVEQALFAEISSNPPVICGDGTAVLDANAIGGGGDYTYSWSPAETLNDPTSAKPIASPSESTTYTVIVNDGLSTVEAQYTLGVFESPVLELGNDTIVCSPFTLLLDGTITNGISYSWSPGGETTPTITVDTTGIGYSTQTYSVLAYDINGCNAEDEITVTFDVCNSISNTTDELNISVYPNPASSKINLALHGHSQQFEYTLMNYQGQVLLSKSMGEMNGFVIEPINIENYAKGIYYLRLNTDKKSSVQKVVIE